MSVQPASTHTSSSSSICPSTLPMSPDRSGAGKLVGELYIAAKYLIEGPHVKLDQVRHEIRTLLGSNGTSTNTSSTTTTTTTDTSTSTNHRRALAPSSSVGPSAASPVSGFASPLEWKNFVAGLLITTEQLPNSVGRLPDPLKRSFAQAIRLGDQLCAKGKAARAAHDRIQVARQIYRTLSGPSYL